LPPIPGLIGVLKLKQDDTTSIVISRYHLGMICPDQHLTANSVVDSLSRRLPAGAIFLVVGYLYICDHVCTHSSLPQLRALTTRDDLHAQSLRSMALMLRSFVTRSSAQAMIPASHTRTLVGMLSGFS